MLKVIFDVGNVKIDRFCWRGYSKRNRIDVCKKFAQLRLTVNYEA